MNQEVEKYLCHFVGYHQNDWVDWLPTCQFTLNNTVKSSTGYTPFKLNLGRHPNPGSNPITASSEMPAMETFVKNVLKSQDSAKKALEKTAENMKKFADRKRGPTPEYTVGQLVLLSSANLSTKQPSAKFVNNTGDKDPNTHQAHAGYIGSTDNK